MVDMDVGLERAAILRNFLKFVDDRPIEDIFAIVVD